MNLRELLTTPIDELYERGILQEPEPERDVMKWDVWRYCPYCNGTGRPDVYSVNPLTHDNGWLMRERVGCALCFYPLTLIVLINERHVEYRSRAVTISDFGRTIYQHSEYDRKHDTFTGQLPELFGYCAPPRWDKWLEDW
jgi:hypothetical protein